MHVTDRELAIILAALRYYQSDGKSLVDHIATNDGQLVPLDDDEIDALCERINCS